jgi:hypothetical protein
MFLVVCEGAIRKWGFPDLQEQIYLVKDGLLIVAYIGFLSSGLRSGVHLRVMGGLKVLMILSVVYFGLEILNPNAPSLILSVVGFKNYLLYAPLAFIVPYMFSSSDDLERKLRLYAFIMIPFAGLGLVQFTFGPDHWINGYLSHDSESLRDAVVFGFSETQRARTSGTFSYIGGYTAFLIVMFYLGAALAASKTWKISESRWPLMLLAVSAAAMFTTGSRGPIYVVTITTPLLLYVWSSSKLMSVRSVVSMGLACVIIYFGVVSVAGDAIQAYEYRSQNSDDPIERLLSPFTEPYAAIQVSPLFGSGLASTNAAALTIMGTADTWWLNDYFEVETARVVQETGVLGFIVVYAARVWLLISAITLGMRFRTPLYVAISGGLAGLFAQDLAFFVINNATGGIYHWFAAGLLFAMYRLECAEQSALASQLAPRVPSTGLVRG